MTTETTQSNFCECGCGTAIAVRTATGAAKRFVNFAHYRRWFRNKTAAPPPDVAATTQWPHARLIALTPEDARELPDALLRGMIRWYARAAGRVRPDQIQLLAAEAQRRGMADPTLRHYIQRMLPSRCACGGPGHYIVGNTTLCPECAKTTGRAKRQTYGQFLDAKTAAQSAEIREREAVQDNARRHHRARGRKPR